MPIENRDLVVEGARLTGRYKKADVVCEVGKDAEGNLVFKIDGKEFGSASKAASHAMGGGSVNGWRFWDLDGAATPANVAADSGETPAKAGRKAKAPKARKFKLITRMEDQPSDLEEGQTAWWCSACQNAFIAGSERPETCAEGHRADDPELTAAPAPEAVEAAEVTA